MKDSELAIGVLRDEKNFVKALLRHFDPKLETNPKVGDKIRIVARPTYEDTGNLILESFFENVHKINDMKILFSNLKVAVSPGKVSSKILMQKTHQ